MKTDTTETVTINLMKFQKIINKIMGNIPSYLQLPNVFTQCIRKGKSLSSQQLIDIDSDCDIDNEEIIYELEKRKYHTHILK